MGNQAAGVTARKVEAVVVRTGGLGRVLPVWAEGRPDLRDFWGKKVAIFRSGLSMWVQ